MLYDDSRFLALCVIILLVSGYASLFLRIYVRLTKSPWGWDDTCAVVGAIPFAWLCAETIIAAKNGLGAHEWHITPEMQKEAYKAFMFFEVSYCTSIILIKLSIALTLTRIITDQTVILWILRGTIALFSAVTLSVAIYCLCQCRPIAKIWDPAIEGYCHPSNVITALSMTVTVTSILSDVIICTLPIPLLWHVQINRYSKLAAGFLLSLGMFATICAIVRLAYTLALTSKEDYLYHIYGVTVWCYAEVGVALTVGSLSALRPLFASCMGSSGSGSRHSRYLTRTGSSNGTYELRSKNGVLHSKVEAGGEIKRGGDSRTGSYAAADNESKRSILGQGRRSDVRIAGGYDGGDGERGERMC